MANEHGKLLGIVSIGLDLTPGYRGRGFNSTLCHDPDGRRGGEVGARVRVRVLFGIVEDHRDLGLGLG